MSKIAFWGLLCAMALIIAGCAASDGGIVGTGNRPDCQPGDNRDDCRPAAPQGGY